MEKHIGGQDTEQAGLATQNELDNSVLGQVSPEEMLRQAKAIEAEAWAAEARAKVYFTEAKAAQDRAEAALRRAEELTDEAEKLAYLAAASNSKKTREQAIRMAIIWTIALLFAVFAIPFAEMSFFQVVTLCVMAYGGVGLGAVIWYCWKQVYELRQATGESDKKAYATAMAKAILGTSALLLIVLSAVFVSAGSGIAFFEFVASQVSTLGFAYGLALLLERVVKAWSDILSLAGD